MDFALQSLPDAFRDAAYQKANSSFKLFCFLLATRADRHLIPELLVHFNELHHATGDDLLVIAPSIHMRIGREGLIATPEEAIEVFETGVFPAYMGSGIESVNVGDQVSRFLRSLTEQAYELSAFLGLERSRIPCLLFFEKLVLPPEFVCWDLSRTNAHDVVLRIRSMLDQLHERCGWDLAKRIATIEHQLTRPNLGVSAEDKRRAEALRCELSKRQQTVDFLSALRDLREACECLLGAERSELPLERAHGNILRLCADPENDLFTTYVRRQRRNWKKRLPPAYLRAVERFLGFAAQRATFWRCPPDGESLGERITSGAKAVAAARAQLDDQLKAIEDAPGRMRESLEAELGALQAKRAVAVASPLEALRSMGFGIVRPIRNESAEPASPSMSGLFEYLSCFISYSSRDTEFAGRLHADLVREGVRCWFAPENLRVGDKFRQRIDDSIHSHDKLLLILSAESIQSDWVEAEVEAAFERERREKRAVLFPIKLDDEVMTTNLAWAAAIRRTRHIGDFRGWISGLSYDAAVLRLLRDLRTESG